MKLRGIRISAAVLLALVWAWAQDTANLKDTTREGRLSPLLANFGNLHAPVTTRSADAQRYFNQGLTLVYAFNHAEALRSFREAARLDPDCAMAYWGQALALAPNINDSAIGPDREQQGFDAIREAVKRKSKASTREKALIDALAARFSNTQPAPDRPALNEAYARAMTDVYKRHSKDPDVAVLYADAVMNTRPWNYWTRDGKPQPGVQEVRAALERTINTYPDHAGARHMYIHLMEASDEVDVATESADRLGGLVPAAGHLVHMPAHIYIRVGRYGDAAEANVRAIAADENYITQCRAQGIYPATYYPHNVHFLNAVLMMEGRSKEAMESARKVTSTHDHHMLAEPGFGFGHLLQTIPLLTMVRFGLWDDILREPAPPADMVFGTAMRHFARGLAYSAKGDPAPAKEEQQALAKTAAHPSLKELKILDLNATATLAEIAVAILEGDLAEKAGESEKAIAAFQRAVAIEDNLLYSEPPDWPIPPRHYLAHAYLTAGNPDAAERIYREDLKRHRGNGWSLAGLAASLEKQGKAADAARARDEFARAWKRADVKLQASRF